jgi:predicted RNase H-like HicB family nuclease
MHLEEEQIDMSTIVVRATWDPEASYWVAESPDVLGLATGAATLNELAAKLPGVIQDLLEGADTSNLTETEIPIEIIASISTTVRVRVAA